MKRFFLFSLILCLLATSLAFSMPMVARAESDVDITSKSACLVDYASGSMLYGHNPKEHLPIASMVKMMTILLTLDEFDKGSLTEETMITTSENASGMGGSQVFIDPYVEYSAGDLLKSVIMASANDASVALAEHISGSEKAFVNKMNQKAKELGISKFTTSLVISPHKNFEKITKIAKSVAQDLEYIAIDFKKKDGFLKTNKLSKELGIYRQNYCGCEFTKR